MVPTSIFLIFYCYTLMYVVFPWTSVLGLTDPNNVDLFMVKVTNNYPSDVILDVAIFNTSILAFGIGGAKIGHRYALRPLRRATATKVTIIRWIYLSFGLFFIISFAPMILEGGLNYWRLDEIRKNNFITFELRILIYLIIVYQFSYAAQLSKQKLIESVILISIVVIFIIFQARSVLLELFVIFIVLATRQLDLMRVNIKYIVAFCLLPFIPNLFVFWRLNMFDNFKENLPSLFQFEYLSLFNVMQFEYFYNYEKYDFFLPALGSMTLMMPGFLRDLIGLDVEKSPFYNQLAEQSGIVFGGMSFPVELFANFGYFSLLIVFVSFFLLSVLRQTFLRRFSSRDFTFFNALYPILTSYLIVSLRNDIGVVLKQVIYLFVTAAILEFLRKLRT